MMYEVLHSIVITNGGQMSPYLFELIGLSDQKAVICLFNHYIEHSFAAYPEHKVPYEFFGIFLNMCKDHPSVTVKNDEGTLAGFGMLCSHNPMLAFSHTAEITYFIRPELTGRGLGGQMLEYLVTEGKNVEYPMFLQAFPHLTKAVFGPIKSIVSPSAADPGELQGEKGNYILNVQCRTKQFVS